MVLNKIKYNYNLKVIEDLFDENKYDEIVSTQQFKKILIMPI